MDGLIHLASVLYDLFDSSLGALRYSSEKSIPSFRFSQWLQARAMKTCSALKGVLRSRREKHTGR